MKQIQANRLVSLMNLMQTIPPKAFDITNWVEYKDYQEKDKIGSKTVELKCGTTACAVGWAAVSLPSWKKHFKFTPSGGMYSTLTDKKGCTFGNEFMAVAEFLGITMTETEYMFSDEGYETEQENYKGAFGEFKVTKPMLFNHCKKVLDNYGYVWAY